jgi:DNA-directed RNA polymerase specialized sigma24 family protein
MNHEENHSVSAQDAWTSTFTEWYPKAYTIVYGRLCHRFNDEALAEDMVTVALAEAGLQPPGYFGSFAHFCNFVYRTAVHRSLDHFRKQKRQRPLPDEELEGRDAGAEGRPVWDKPAEEVLEALEAGLKKLPEPERKALTEYFAGKTDAQLGIALFAEEATPGALGQRARRLRLRALRNLRSILAL